MSVLVLVSGGMDSSVLAEKAQREERLGGVVYFDYGQPAADYERKAAYRLWEERWSTAEFFSFVVPVEGLEQMQALSGAPGPRIVPARNLVLLSHGVNIAAAHEYKSVWLGATYDDQIEYVDCRPTFEEHLRRITGALFGVRVKFPFVGRNKRNVVELGRNYGLDFDMTWSCYAPLAGGHPCGTCNACTQRSRALETTDVST